MATSATRPELPAGARVVATSSTTAAPTETYSRATVELVDLRVSRLLPLTTQRAQQRLAMLKQLFVTPRATVKATHARAVQSITGSLRLTKSVRNVKRLSETRESVVGTLCLPFYSCAALASTPTSSTSVLLATGSVDGLVTVWDTANCRPLCSASTCVDGGGWGRVRSLAAHPTVPICFSTTMFDHRIRAWRVQTQSPSATEAHPDVGNEEDNEKKASQESWELSMAAATNGDSMESGHVARINRLAVDPTGTLLASTSDDTTLRLWDVRRLDDAAPQSLSLTARNLHRTQQQQQTAADGSLSLPLLLTHDGYSDGGPVLGVDFHPDGALVSTSDAGGRVITWDTRTGQLAFATAGSLRGGHLGRATCVAWSPCGVRLASAGADGVVQLWDARMIHRSVHADTNAEGRRVVAQGAAPYMMLGHDDVVTSLSFYTDVPTAAAASSSWRSVMPTAVVTTSLDGTVRFWDADTGLCAHTLHADGPVYGQCRLRGPSTTTTAATAQASAIVTVGHSKYWSMWDLVDDAAAFQAQCAETDEGVGGFAGAAAEKGESGSDAEEDSDDEDEMAALRKPPSAAPAPARNEEEDDEEDEDEMAALRRK